MIRIFYFILWIFVNYALRVYFKSMRSINNPFQLFGRTIYVSNHSAAFMDPLVVACQRWPIVFFMTRSDIFTKFTKPFLWAAHMLPIYRQHDGHDTKTKNNKVFDQSAKVLRYGRNLLIFGEGFTDDTFVRRLKPVKKGPVRIGFYTLEKYNWKKKIYVAAVGCNYTNPNYLRSDLLISCSDKICLNDYKEKYLENPNKVISELTKQIELMMQAQITHVQDLKLCPLHENIMCMTGKGMNPKQYNPKYSLVQRWKYSQNLANSINQNADALKLNDLPDRVSFLCNRAKKMGIHFMDVEGTFEGKDISYMRETFLLCLLFPVYLLGLIQTYIPFVLVKKYVQKSFKRSVFWGSVKLLLGTICIGITNLALVLFLCSYFSISGWLGFLYLLCIGPIFIGFLKWREEWSNLQRKKLLTERAIQEIASERKILVDELSKIISI